MAWCIVNSPPDNKSRENQVPLTPTSIFNRFKKQSFGSREFKKGLSQISAWGSSAHLSDPTVNNVITNPAMIHNLFSTSNDNVDVSGVSNDAPIGSANGYIFPKPAKITQGFKTFGIKLGRFVHLYGAGAFYNHREYPHEARWKIKLIINLNSKFVLRQIWEKQNSFTDKICISW